MKDVSANEIIEQVYDRIFKNISENLKLHQPVWAKIGDDSDHHKIREFHMEYTKAKKTALSEKDWIFAYGKVGDTYVTNVSATILAFPKDGWRRRNEFKPILPEPSSIEEKIEREGYYFHSVVLASSAEGTISTLEDTKLEHWRLRNRLNSKLYGLREFVKTPTRANEELVAVSTMRPVLKQGALYSAEAVGFLIPKVEEILLEMAKINTGN